jgi:biopolymer transport protein ExbD
MNFRKKQRVEEPEINLIAFIDVLLVIMIFLMVTTTYSKFTALKVTLPTADAEQVASQPREINVAVDAQGQYAVNNVRIAVREPADLARELSRVAGSGGVEPVVIINADALAAHQTVINVLEAAQISGLAKVTFAAQTAKK